MENKISDDVGTEVTYFATNADAEIRIHYAEILLRVLDKPIRVIRDYIHKITSTLLLVSEDAEKSVRLSLVIRIPEIYTRCRKIAVPEFDFFLDDRLLEIVLRYLHDAEPEVVSKAYVTTMTLLQKRLLTKAAIEERLCPAIVELSRATIVHPAHQVDYETNSIELMKLIAPIVGAPATREHLIGRFVEMCANEMHFVRKSCAEYFPVFCQVLGTEDTEALLLPVFVRLCEDAVWGVRKTAAGSLLKVALMCSLAVRRARLAPMVYRLLNDPSRWVGMIAFESLGQFISLFAQPCITGLTYTELGELNIMNAANPEFKHQCSHNLIANFAHYERIFAESLTPPTDDIDDNADATDETRSSNNNTTGTVIHQLNRTAANNNNCYLKNSGDADEPTSANPLKQFLSPQQYDENCLSTIEKIGQRLEEFYAAAATPSSAALSPSQTADTSAEEEMSAADSSSASLADMSSSDASVFNGLDDEEEEDEDAEADQQQQALAEKVEAEETASVDNDSSKLLNNINNNATTTTNTTTLSASPLNISNIINNNNATDDATSTEQPPQLATNTARLQANAADDDDAATRTPLTLPLPPPPPPPTTTTTAVAAPAAPSHNNHNHNHTRKHSKSQRKSRSKAVAAAAAAAAATAAAAAAAAAADAAKADDSSSSSTATTTTTTTSSTTNETIQQQLPSDDTSDCNDSTPSPSPPAPLLRKNTPADLPQIIKQAIDTTTKPEAVAGGRARRGPAAALNIALANQPPPPPETPAIEESPQQALDFTDPAPQPLPPASVAAAPTRTDEQLLAAGDYDNNQENAPEPIDLLQMLGVGAPSERLQEPQSPQPPQLDDDPADLQTEYASVHYWHLEPAQPAGWEAELELAAATSKADYVLRLKDENGEDLRADDEDDENDEDGDDNDDEDDDDEDDDDDDDDDDGYDNTQSPLLSHIFQSVTINDIYSESSKGQNAGQVLARNSIGGGGGMRGGNNNSGGGGGNNDPQSDNSANNVDSGWLKALAALQPPEATTTTAAVAATATAADATTATATATGQPDAGLLDSSALNTPYVQPVVPGYLVRYYVSMVGFNDGLMNMHCAYNFPAVVLTLGRPHWHLAQRLLKLLCDDIQWKIRKTVAVFIYQIALIIGRELAGRDLVPIFMGFFKDLDEVKIEALRNLTNFLRVIDIRHHHQIVFRLGSCLNNYANNYANWRFREELAQQVLNLIEVYGNVYNADGMTFLVGIAINLLSDEVCSVREIAQNAIVATFKICAPCDTGDLISLLTDEFAGSTFWRKRQIYISICYKLIAENAITDELFESRLLGSLLPLANDAVPNIRLNVGKLLSRMLLHHEYYAMRPVHERIAQIVALLREDQDRDVRFMAADVDDPPNDSSTTSSSSSGSGNDASNNDVSTTISDAANSDANSDANSGSSSVAVVADAAAAAEEVDVVASSPIPMPPASEMW